MAKQWEGMLQEQQQPGTKAARNSSSQCRRSSRSSELHLQLHQEGMRAIRTCVQRAVCAPVSRACNSRVSSVSDCCMRWFS